MALDQGPCYGLDQCHPSLAQPPSTVVQEIFGPRQRQCPVEGSFGICFAMFWGRRASGHLAGALATRGMMLLQSLQNTKQHQIPYLPQQIRENLEVLETGIEPLAEILLCCGFFLIYFVEDLVYICCGNVDYSESTEEIVMTE